MAAVCVGRDDPGAPIVSEFPRPFGPPPFHKGGAIPRRPLGGTPFQKGAGGQRPPLRQQQTCVWGATAPARPPL